MRGRTYKLLASAHLVRIVFDRMESDRTIQPVFECVPCEEFLRWDAAHGLWVCSYCQHEFWPDEALWLVKSSREGLDALNKEVIQKRGKKWALVSWFKGLWSGRQR